MREITFVMVVYGGLDYLIPCLNSLSNTTYDFNLIIVDNNSSEVVCEYLEWWKKETKIPVEIYYLRKNIGVWAAKAIAFEQVKTPYLGYLHQDMYFQYPEWLKDAIDDYKNGQMYFLNQYYIERKEKRAIQGNHMLYSFIMDTTTYQTCPVDYRYFIYVEDIEHQMRFVQMYGIDKRVISKKTKVYHRSGICVLECGKLFIHRILERDRELFKKIYKDYGIKSPASQIGEALKGKPPIEITPLPENILDWITK